MHKIIKYSFIALSFIGIVSCYKSDENYEYGVGYEFGVEDLESSYNLVTSSDTLKIYPNVTLYNENDDISYIWTKFEYLENSYSFPDNIPTDTISMEKNLEYVIFDEPANYTVALEMKNHTTGQIAYVYTKLAVRNKYSLGFYILKEVNGESDIDLYYDEETMYHDLLYNSRGSRVSGSPSWLTLYPSFESTNLVDGAFVTTKENALVVLTDNDFEVISLNDLDLLMNHSTVYSLGEQIDETPIYFSSYDGGYYGTGSLFVSNMYASYGYYSGAQMMSLNLNTYSCDLDNFAAVNLYDNFLFDKNAGRFVYNSETTMSFFSDVTEGQLASETPSNPYLPNGIDDELLFLGRTTIGADDPVCYAIFKDNDDANKMLFYNLDFYTMVENPYYQYAPSYYDQFIVGVTSYNPIESVTEITGMKMNEAKCFASNETSARAIYYGVGDKLYTYTPLDGVEVETSLNDFPNGEEITYIYHYYWSCEDLADDKFDYLAVGTQVGDNYSIYMYSLVGSTPVGDPVKVIKGEGKLKRIQYSSPTMTSGGYKSYPRSMN